MTDLELSATSRALLDAARDGLGPDPAAVARMRARIGAAVGGGAVAGVTASTFTLANKLGLVALALAVGTGAAVLATRSSAPADEPIAALAIEAPAPTAVTVASAGSAREVVPEVAAPAPAAPEIEMAPVRVTKPVERAPRTIDLGREVELVDRAMAALRSGDYAAALVAVRLHATETGGAGQLAEDAAAIEIDALCKRKDPAAPRKLAAFDARWPSSAQRAKLCR
jgi:hypothetical protein